MKAFKKLSMLFVAAAMMMTTVSTAFAANDVTTGNGTIKIGGTGRNYVAYRVLDSHDRNVSPKITMFEINENFKNFFKDGDYSFNADKGILKGQDVLIKTDSKPQEQNNEKTYTNQSEENIQLTTALVTYLNGRNVSEDSKYAFNSNTETTVEQGLYLVLDKTTTMGDSNIKGNKNDGRVPSKPILVRVDDGGKIDIYPKDAKLDVTKTVNSGATSIDGIGEVLKYEIVSSIPTYGPDYENIKLRIKDKLSKGLTYTGNLSIKLGEDILTYEECVEKGYLITQTTNDDPVTIIPKDNTEGASINIEFNYENVIKKYAGQTIVVSYEATVNKNASVGNATNNNNAELEYTNSPSGDTSAIPVETKTYSYGIRIAKRNATNPAELLTGAKFCVYNNKSCEKKDYVAEFDPATDAGYYELNGLGDGTYYIVEEKAPDGYSKLDGYIEIKITATDDPTTPSIEIVDVNGELADFIPTTDESKIKDGVISIYVNNYKGINLPETGGMGTTIFMIGGAALIALAGVMLVVYSKKSKKA